MDKLCVCCSKEFHAEGRNLTRRKYCSKKCQVSSVQKNYYRRHPEKLLDKRKKSSEDWVRKTLWNIKSRAKLSGIDFNLEYGDLELPEVCPILGIPLVRVYGSGKKIGYRPNAPSVDRIDPSKGYVKGNVRVLSARANLLKNNAELWELEKVLEDLRCINRKL